MRILLLFFVIALGAAQSVSAQAFPERPVRVIVPFPAGGSADYVMRLVGERLTARWGKPFIVDNRPGGGALIGTQAVAKAAPDGHTLGLVAASFVVQPALRKSMPYDVLNDFDFITLIMETPFVLTVNAQTPAPTIRDLVAYAKANPGKLNFGSFGIGSTPHILAEILSQEAGIKLVHVPFKGSPDGIAAQVAGDVQLNFDIVMSPMPHIRSGKLRPLVVTSAARYADLPDVPTTAEAGLGGLETTAWFGLVAPAKLPPEVLASLNASFVEVLRQPAISQALAKQGMSVRTSSPEQFRRFAADSVRRFGAAVNAAGIPPAD
jgi:tripartite-type tricarboxylate transporter receptor subunit TctC